MKKILSLLVMALLATSISLAGCSGVDNSTEVPEDADNYDKTESPVSGEAGTPTPPNDGMPMPGK